MSESHPPGPEPELELKRDARPEAVKGAVDRSSSRAPTFYTPPPSVTREASGSDSAPTGKSAGGLVAAGLLTVALALGAWYSMAGPGPAPPPSPPIAGAPQQQKIFVVAASDVDQAATDRLKAMLSGSGGQDAAELKATNAPALAEMQDKAPQLAEEIKSDQRRLYRVHLLDFLAQDGDFIEFVVDGVSMGDINLSNAGQEFLLPLAVGKPTEMKVIAKMDGGGGVTVAFVSGAGEAKTNVMQVGDVDQWQVVVK